MAVLACSIDGVIQSAPFPLFRAVQFGDGLFETIAIIRGQPLFWTEHMIRLRRGAELLGIDLLDDAQLLTHWQQLRQTLLQAKMPAALVLKIVLARREGTGYATPPDSPGELLFVLQDWPQRPAAYWQEGVVAGLSTVPLQSGAPYLTLKSLNRLNQIMARRSLPPAWQEAVLCDREGLLREGIQSNLFWRQGAQIFTPDLGDGGITGIQLAAILQQLAAWGWQVHRLHLAPPALLAAEEIFFCNSLIGFWPVRRWQERELPGASGTLAQRLADWHRQLGLFPEAA
ncbi:MAG: aminotransferase class IV [Candidatus Igneacidithiobacillus chanchocoensis]